MLSTNLREVSQCLEKAPTRTFPYWERLLLRPLNLLGSSLVAPAMFHLVPPSCVSSPASVFPVHLAGRTCAAPLVTRRHGCCSAGAASCTTYASALWPAPGTRRASMHRWDRHNTRYLDICLHVNIINVGKTQNQKLWQITLRWWLRRNVFQSKHWFKYLYVYFIN